MPALPTVLVADSAPTRFGVRLALDGYATVCAEAEEHDEAVRVAGEIRPDICLVGRSIPGGGIETVRQICQFVPETSVLVLADSDDVGDLVIALRAGAIGYLPAGFGAGELRRAIDAVMADQAAIPRSLVKELVDEIRTLELASERELTPRETEVLVLLRRGHSTRGIADTLAISPVTVRRHISLVVQKTGVRGRAGLLAAYARGSEIPIKT